MSQTLTSTGLYTRGVGVVPVHLGVLEPSGGLGPFFAAAGAPLLWTEPAEPYAISRGLQ